MAATLAWLKDPLNLRYDPTSVGPGLEFHEVTLDI